MSRHSRPSKESTFERTRRFLESNQVHTEWIHACRKNVHLQQILSNSIKDLHEEVYEYSTPCIPKLDKILLALSRCSPRDVKVVIVGHDPIPDESLATGFAFSFPERKFIDVNVHVGRTDYELGTGRSLAILHTVLVDAGYLEPGGTYDGCHEVWADRGVLLLNASLTYDEENGHFNIWENVVGKLLLEVVKRSQQGRLFFLFWGTNADNVGESLYEKLSRKRKELYVTRIRYNHRSDEIRDGSRNARTVLYIGDHPTYPKDYNGFLKQAPNQFRTIKACYPDLFNLTNLGLEEKESCLEEEAREGGKDEGGNERRGNREIKEEKQEGELKVQKRESREEDERTTEKRDILRKKRTDNISQEEGYEREIEGNEMKRRRKVY